MSFLANTNYKGIQLNGAYFTIFAVGGTKNNAVIELHCYATEELYRKDKSNNITENKLYSDTSLNFTPDVSDSAENWIKQAYKCTELLDRFPNKINMLELGQTTQ